MFWPAEGLRGVTSSPCLTKEDTRGDFSAVVGLCNLQPVSESKPHPLKHTFPKSERLHSKKLIQELFEKGSSFYIYPFKVLFLPLAEEGVHQVLFSVSKKKFKRAVDRNLIKRKIREAYRLNKHQLCSLPGKSSLLMAYIYTGKKIPEYHFLEKRLLKSLRRLIENLHSP